MEKISHDMHLVGGAPLNHPEPLQYSSVRPSALKPSLQVIVAVKPSQSSWIVTSPLIIGGKVSQPTRVKSESYFIKLYYY